MKCVFSRKQSDIRFTRKQICEASGWSYWQVNDHLKQLVDQEYLILYGGGERNRYSYELIWDGKGGENERFFSGLIDLKKLKKKSV